MILKKEVYLKYGIYIILLDLTELFKDYDDKTIKRIWRHIKI